MHLWYSLLWLKIWLEACKDLSCSCKALGFLSLRCFCRIFGLLILLLNISQVELQNLFSLYNLRILQINVAGLVIYYYLFQFPYYSHKFSWFFLCWFYWCHFYWFCFPWKSCGVGGFEHVFFLKVYFGWFSFVDRALCSPIYTGWTIASLETIFYPRIYDTVIQKVLWDVNINVPRWVKPCLPQFENAAVKLLLYCA